MEIGKKYAPPDCPTYMFFAGKALDDVLSRKLLAGKDQKIAAGTYSYKKESIFPVRELAISRVRQLCETDPEKIIAAPLEQMVKLDGQSHLVQGRLGIYENWETFAIEDILHPLGSAYMTQLGSVVVEQDYKRKTKDRESGQRRFQFIGGSEIFDPLVRGLSTWDANFELVHPYGKEETYNLAIILTPKTLKSILREARNKNVQLYGEFLDRVGKVDGKIKDFLEYSNDWALKHRKTLKSK